MARLTKEKMDKIPDHQGLKGQFLVASPAMEDPRFERSVIYMLEYDQDKAMGIVINKIFEEIHFVDLLEQLDIDYSVDLTDYAVLLGGPVEIGRGFVLHTPDMQLPDTVIDQNNNIAMTTSLDMLSKIAKGQGPEKSIFCLGYSGWSAGQLDEELRDNGWICVPANTDILFKSPVAKRWQNALELSGISVDRLSSFSGQA